MPEATSNETIRERIIRLIGEMRNRTVDRGATPGEAAGFAAKVAEWIEKYQISEAELQGKDGGDSEYVEVCQNYLRTGKKVHNPGATQVVNALSIAMCCKCILDHRGGEAVYGVIGNSLDADYVCQMSVTLIPLLRTMGNMEGAEHGEEKAGLVKWTNQYLTGAAVEIQRRIEAERKDRSDLKEMEQRLLGGRSTALVVVTGESLALAKRLATATAFKEAYPHVRHINTRAKYNHEAHERGRAAGKTVGLNLAVKG